MSPEVSESSPNPPGLRRVQEILLHLARVWQIDSPKQLARRLIELRKNRFAGLDGVVPDEEEREEFEGFVRSKMSLKGEGEGALAAIIGRTFRYQRRFNETGMARPSLAQRQAHASELARLFLGPEALLASTPADFELARYANQHLTAYREVKLAEAEMARAAQEWERLTGRPLPFDALFLPWEERDRLIAGEVGDHLLQKVREVTRRLYPGLPEMPDHGPSPSWGTNPAAIASRLWELLNAHARSLERPSVALATVPAGSAWRVELGGSTLALVENPAAAKVAELTEEMNRLLSDPELIDQAAKVQAAEERVRRTRETYLSEVRRLGRRIEHGEPLRGRCDLGY